MPWNDETKHLVNYSKLEGLPQEKLTHIDSHYDEVIILVGSKLNTHTVACEPERLRDLELIVYEHTFHPSNI